MASYHVIFLNADGKAYTEGLRPWVRANMPITHTDFKEEQNTRSWRDSLKRLGWVQKEVAGKVYVIRPDPKGSIEYANSILSAHQNNKVVFSDSENTREENTNDFGVGLHQALLQNIQLLEPNLEIVDDDNEKHTEEGFTTITSKDAHGKPVIIVCNASMGESEIITQTLAVMQEFQEEEEADIRGIIVASSFTNLVKLAARQIPNLKLVTYVVQFNFNQVD